MYRILVIPMFALLLASGAVSATQDPADEKFERMIMATAVSMLDEEPVDCSFGPLCAEKWQVHSEASMLRLSNFISEVHNECREDESALPTEFAFNMEMIAANNAGEYEAYVEKQRRLFPQPQTLYTGCELVAQAVFEDKLLADKALLSQSPKAPMPLFSSIPQRLKNYANR
ncbi:hypothetical protein [Vibrio sp. SCSIO 43136]|uniref:hypothetical protein n=1 Tax=Vibrio sp. SCSIO 43136 TaxID=2819101 RepID=UPI002074FD40|nr:hypothetical protein [Vibrio sp. SCSIO 43136]USD67582.1 hypothetical protein J4N39_15410 [Vibrio sp. SCSIO 43136]